MKINNPAINLSLLRRFLLVRTDRIGDMLVTTPAIRAIRMAIPDATIDVLASPLNSPVIKNNPYINNIFTFYLRKPWTWPTTILKLRQQNYDAILFFNSKSHSTFHFCSLLKASLRIPLGTPLSGKYDYIPAVTTESHVLFSTLIKLENMGIPSQSHHMDFLVPQRSIEAMSLRFPVPSTNVIRIAIFIGNIKKIQSRWPIEKFHSLISQLLQRENDLEVLILAGLSDEPLMSHLKDLSHPRVLRFISNSLQDTGAVIQTCNAFVGGSSGPSHLATALNVPTLSMGQQHSYRNWRPLNERDRFVMPEDKHQDTRDIEVSAVMDMIEEFLSEQRKQNTNEQDIPISQ